MKKILFGAFVCASAAAFAAAPKYVFVFIGDGMSTPQRLMAEDFSKRTGRGELAMNHLARRTETATKSANKVVTDSAAAATAIACGEKTDNGMLGMRPDGTRLESVAAVAKKAGRKVGIVTTVTIVHATPAGFYAHNRSRGDSRAIAMDLVKSGFDYFAGGGIGGWTQPKGGYFDTNGNFVKLEEGREAVPGIDPYSLWQTNGYTFVKDDLAAFKALKPGRPVWCVFGESGMDYALDRDGSQPTLAEIVEKGIELLDGPDGFFLMCEGGKVDYAGHANDAGGSVAEQLSLDDAVKVATRFAKAHPGETLIVTTGDHETGGLIRGITGAGAAFDPALLKHQRCTASKFSSILKNAQEKNAAFSFDDAMALVRENFGLGGPVPLTDADRDELKKAFEQKKPAEFAGAAKRILSAHAGLAWKSGGHTALPTMTTAEGPGSEILEGMTDNTEIGARLKGLYTR